jgi:predicted NUDIX family NTP pyrophosphohydrolase
MSAGAKWTVTLQPETPVVVHRAGDPLDLGVVELDGGGLIVRWAHDGEIDTVEVRAGTMYVEGHGWRLDPVTRRTAYVQAIRAASDAAYARESNGATWARTE